MPNELSDQQTQKLQHALGLVKELLALPTVSKHDTRFDAEIALLSPKDGLAAALEVIETHAGKAVKAPSEPVPTSHAKLADSFGGIRGGQTLYVKSVDDGLCVYVALWPWGDGSSITIKIGVREIA